MKMRLCLEKLNLKGKRTPIRKITGEKLHQSFRNLMRIEERGSIDIYYEYGIVWISFSVLPEVELEKILLKMMSWIKRQNLRTCEMQIVSSGISLKLCGTLSEDIEFPVWEKKTSK